MPERPAIDIALWGLTGSGKTAVLAYLLHSSPLTLWDVMRVNEAPWFATSEWRDQNKFPGGTRVTEEGQDPSRAVYKLRRGERAAMLSVEDRAGQEWKSLKKQVKEALQKAHALIVLLDPESPSEDQVRETLDTLCEDLGKEREERPVALCLTKADTLIETVDDLMLAERDPDRFVGATGRVKDSLRTIVSRRCANARLFAISAVGAEARFGVVRPAVIIDETLQSRPAKNVRPINLMEPFDWIFSMVGEAT